MICATHAFLILFKKRHKHKYKELRWATHLQGTQWPSMTKMRCSCIMASQRLPWEESISKMQMGESLLLSFHIKDSGSRPLEKKNYCCIVPVCRHKPFVTNLASPTASLLSRAKSEWASAEQAFIWVNLVPWLMEASSLTTHFILSPPSLKQLLLKPPFLRFLEALCFIHCLLLT